MQKKGCLICYLHVGCFRSTCLYDLKHVLNSLCTCITLFFCLFITIEDLIDCHSIHAFKIFVTYPCLVLIVTKIEFTAMKFAALMLSHQLLRDNLLSIGRGWCTKPYGRNFRALCMQLTRWVPEPPPKQQQRSDGALLESMRIRTHTPSNEFQMHEN